MADKARECQKIAAFQKNSREEIRVLLREFKGHLLLDFRIFFRLATGEPKPSVKGVAMPIRLFPEFKEAVLEAENRLKQEGLMTADGVMVVSEEKKKK